jgi:glutathione S-transferase
MASTLYAIPGSPPCAAVARALELKKLEYERVDLLPVAHKVVQRRRFGRGTVPGVVLDGGERIVGSEKILRRLDELVADPPLYPADRRCAPK